MSKLTISCLKGLLVSCFAAANSVNRVQSSNQFVRTSVFFAARFTLSRLSIPVRSATNLLTFCFREYLIRMSFEKFLSEPACSSQLGVQ